MKTKIGLVLIVLMVVALGGFSNPASPAQAQSGKQVWVFYMGFWTPHGWAQRENVLTDFPLDRYNSADAGVAARQIGEAQSAGIDAFVVSWFGSHEGQTTAVLNTMLDQAASRGFQIGAALDTFSGGVNRDMVINSLNYIVHDRANHSAYLRYNGKPVIYFAFQEGTGFSTAEWQEIRNIVDPDHHTIWVAQGLNGCCIHGGAFDGMYAFNVAWGSPAGTARAQYGATRNAGGTFYTPTAHPGWDEDNIAELENRPNPTSARSRANGNFLRNSFNGAASIGTDVILIVSWNEFMEGSHIEPSVNYGTQSLDILRGLIGAWKGTGGGSSAIAPSVSNFPSGTTYLTANAQVNVRTEGSMDGVILGRIEYLTQHEVLGESNGWYAIAFNGQTGWVSGDWVTVRTQP